MRPLITDFFFFNDTATTEIYTLSLHDALPIFGKHRRGSILALGVGHLAKEVLSLLEAPLLDLDQTLQRSEEHTSELQSPDHLVCRLLLEKKKKKTMHQIHMLLLIYVMLN